MVLVIPIHFVTTETKNCLNILTQNVYLQSLLHICVNIFRLFFVSMVTQCIAITRIIPAFLYYREPSYTVVAFVLKYSECSFFV